MKQLARIDIAFIPYKGNAPALNAVLGGHVSAMIDTLTTSLPFVQAEDEMAAYFRKNNVRTILDLGFTKKLPIEEVVPLHDYAIATQRKYPDVIHGIWVQVDPRTGRDSAQKLERCMKASSGFVSYCVVGAGMGYPASDPVFAPFYEVALEANAPVLVMVGTTGLPRPMIYSPRDREVMSIMGARRLIMQGVRLICCGLGAEPRDALEELWGAKVMQQYGTNESGMMSAECPFQHGFHIFEDACLLEMADPETHKPVPHGEKGNTLITCLYKYAAPVIRFDSNDVSAFCTGACPCGGTHRRMQGIFGRADNMVRARHQRVPRGDCDGAGGRRALQRRVFLRRRCDWRSAPRRNDHQDRGRQRRGRPRGAATGPRAALQGSVVGQSRRRNCGCEIARQTDEAHVDFENKTHRRQPFTGKIIGSALHGGKF